MIKVFCWIWRNRLWSWAGYHTRSGQLVLESNVRDSSLMSAKQCIRFEFDQGERGEGGEEKKVCITVRVGPTLSSLARSRQALCLCFLYSAYIVYNKPLSTSCCCLFHDAPQRTCRPFLRTLCASPSLGSYSSSCDAKATHSFSRTTFQRLYSESLPSAE